MRNLLELTIAWLMGFMVALVTVAVIHRMTGTVCVKAIEGLQ